MKIIGHRGARNEAPENTIEGFVLAQQNGCEHFELDIQLSLDQQLVVYHDKTLKRTSGIHAKVRHTPLATLQKTDSRHNTPGWHSPCYIAHLQEVVDSVPATKSWQFEVKSTSKHAMKIIIRRLRQFILNNNLYDTAVVTSSNTWFLRELKRSAPHLRTGYVAEFRYRDPVKLARRLGCVLLAVNERLITPSVVSHAKAAGMELSCWTVNDLKKMEELRTMGVDSIITDTPSSALAHFSKPLSM